MKLVSNSEQPEILESCFQTMAHLFKYLSKFLVPTISSVFESLSPLLHGKLHLRAFMAEAFGFLVRKIKSTDILRGLLSKMMQFVDLHPTEQVCQGIALVLFETVKVIYIMSIFYIVC